MRRSLNMGRASLLFALFAGLISVNAAKNGSDHTNHISQALRSFFPVNIVQQIPKTRSNNSLNRVDGSKCDEQVKLLQDGLKSGSIWALQMIDASSKLPSGILMGNNIDLGMFDQCVAIRANEGSQEIRGRHCMYNALAGLGPMHLSETLSICLPATCGPEDVQRIVQSALDQIGQIGSLVGVNIPITVGETTCTSVEPAKWTPGGIITLIGFSLLLLFLVGCTVCDILAIYLHAKPPPNSRLDVLRQFSLYANAARVLSTKTSPQTLPALQGLRFFSMCWVIIGHSYMMMFGQPTVNLLDLMMFAGKWDSLYIMTATFSVDSFFAISGFLMSYIFLKEMSTGRRFNLFGYYLHRYLRLTPAFAAMLLFTLFIVPRLGSGALWEKSTNLEEDSCRSNWWTMLLYLHNYVNVEQMGCLGHTWYLAVEMQFFWVSPLILYPLAKKPRLGLCVLAAFFVASIAVPVKIGYDNEYSTTMISNRAETGNDGFMENFYVVSHVRAAPWIIGMFFGYLTFANKESSTFRVTKWIGWFLATAAFAFCIFTMRIFESEDYKYDIVWESIYTAVARPFWGFAVSWVIYACVRGFGGPVSTFLSFPIFTPLSRISYCVYLVHYQIQFMKIRSTRTPRFFSPFNAFDGFLSDLMLSIMIGFVFTIVFESPVLVAEKIVKKLRAQPQDDGRRILEVEQVEKGIDNPGLTSS